MRVFDIAHGGEWDVNYAVNVVITFLHLRLQHADDLKAHAFHADNFAQGVSPGK